MRREELICWASLLALAIIIILAIATGVHYDGR